jgi:serine/threonine protein phosphatase 1
LSVYVIPDIHGHADELNRVLDLIERDGGPDAEVIFLGDYIDRGPDSRAVLDLLSNGVDSGKNWTCLKGNHDRMMEFFFADPMRMDPQFLPGYDWFHPKLGGIATLASYGIEVTPKTSHLELRKLADTLVPDRHISFVRDLKLTHIHGDLLFVHAGIRPGVALEDQQEQDLVWIRQEFHRATEPHPFLIVHGHTVVDQPTHYGNRVNLDAGAAFGRPLSVAVFEGQECWLLEPNGRVPLTP